MQSPIIFSQEGSHQETSLKSKDLIEPEYLFIILVAYTLASRYGNTQFCPFLHCFAKLVAKSGRRLGQAHIFFNRPGVAGAVLQTLS